MPKTGTLTKSHIIDNVTEANGFTRIKSVENDVHFKRKALPLLPLIKTAMRAKLL
jgi:hypothetical protein